MAVPARRRLHGWIWPPGRLVAGTMLAAFAGWEGVQGRFSAASHVSILAVIAAVLVLAVVAGHARQREPSLTWLTHAVRAPGRALDGSGAGSTMAVGTLVWTLVIVATVAWDVVSFVAQRHSLPTLSRLFGDVTDHEWGRALVFALWLALGVSLATARRRPRAREDVR